MQRRRVLHRRDAVQFEQLVQALARVDRLDKTQHASIAECFKQVDGQQGLLRGDHLYQQFGELFWHAYIRRFFGVF